MRTWVQEYIWPSIASFALLFAHAGQAGAAVGVAEGYNPKDDPNYAEATSGSLSARLEAVRELVKEFEAGAIPTVNRRQGSQSSAAAQPDHYTQATPPAAEREPTFVDPFSYPYGRWNRRWWDSSPRIPWWSLIPFARGDKDFFDHFGHFPFGHHRGGRFHFGFGHVH